MIDVSDIGEFYSTRLGMTARRLIADQLAKRWESLKGANILGLGYAMPYLDMWCAEADRVINFMPARLGARHWPQGKSNLTCLVDNGALPLDDSSIDFALVMHGAELAHDLPVMLSDLWRVLAGQGRVVFVVPNRRGMWARFDNTPFGHGHPFSSGQITQKLREAGFVPGTISNALMIPPSKQRFILKSATAIEHTGLLVSPGFSGILIADATKQLYASAAGKTVKRSIKILAPKPATVPAIRSKI